MAEVEKKRILGLDFGDRTVGVAVSDALSLTAQGVGIIRRERPDKLRHTLAEIERLCLEYSVGRIVLGLPLNMDGSEGGRCKKTREFAELLKRRTHLPVDFEDERLTTEESYDIMKETGQKDQKKYIDCLAAMLILRAYMENHISE